MQESSSTAACILLIEDDPHMGLLLKENLIQQGFNTILATDGWLGIEQFRNNPVDLCLIDIMLPKQDGLSVAREIRKLNPDSPFIFLTAKAMTADKLEGFKTGCDDYVTKPFELQELIYRVKAVLGRTMTAPDVVTGPLALGGLTLDATERVLRKGRDETKLSSKECELLLLFAQNLNEVVSRSQILKRVWGTDNYFASKSLDVYLTKVRKYLRKDAALDLQNIHGFGYKLVVKR